MQYPIHMGREITPDYARAMVKGTVIKYQLLTGAVKAVAGVCDGARTLDGVGFNGADSQFGKGIAEKSPYAWTPKMRHVAYKMMRKYASQLETVHGIDFARIPEPPVPTPELTDHWKICKSVSWDAYQKNQSYRAGTTRNDSRLVS